MARPGVIMGQWGMIMGQIGHAVQWSSVRLNGD